MNNEDKKFFSKPVTKVFVHAFNSKARIVIEQGGSRCFDGNTLVLTKRGEIPIKEIVIGDIVKSFNESNGLFEWKEVQDTFKMANTKPTVRIKLKNGQEIICTEDHKFFYEGGWVSIRNILSLLNENRT